MATVLQICVHGSVHQHQFLAHDADVRSKPEGIVAPKILAV
eukprot:CAMPEP_0206515296 /NCGR_PEP_ID=MMETSP0324_2-20121206/62704_1 /ASSEMBLY_ACC=CAM_ASM_000836 /TAXON_ID=2866 /ORGANISM="Crypthecodinium cohnii, Strain Seligo" /LENGTH=40 /DNA_ID= /DNA_START= /DNA_END= /DNA_ORIENTATION=